MVRLIQFSFKKKLMKIINDEAPDGIKFSILEFL